MWLSNPFLSTYNWIWDYAFHRSSRILSYLKHDSWINCLAFRYPSGGDTIVIQLTTATAIILILRGHFVCHWHSGEFYITGSPFVLPCPRSLSLYLSISVCVSFSLTVIVEAGFLRSSYLILEIQKVDAYCPRESYCYIMLHIGIAEASSPLHIL